MVLLFVRNTSQSGSTNKPAECRLKRHFSCRVATKTKLDQSERYDVDNAIRKQSGIQVERKQNSVSTFLPPSDNSKGESVSSMMSTSSRHQTACAHRSLPRYYSNNYGKQSANVGGRSVGNGMVYSSSSTTYGGGQHSSLACDDSYLTTSSGRKSDANDSSLMEGYELSTEFQQKHVEMLERKYGGRIRARRAAIIIQRAYRKYRLEKKFENLRMVAADRRSGGKSGVSISRFYSAGSNGGLMPVGYVHPSRTHAGQRVVVLPTAQHQQQYHLQQDAEKTTSRRGISDEGRGAACADIISQESPADGKYEMKRYQARVIMGNQQHTASLSSSSANDQNAGFRRVASAGGATSSRLRLHRYNVDGGGNYQSSAAVAGQFQQEASPRGTVLHKHNSSSIHVKVTEVKSAAELVPVEREERQNGNRYRPPAVNILRNRSLSVERTVSLAGGALSVASSNRMEEGAGPGQRQPNELYFPYASYVRLAPTPVTQQHSLTDMRAGNALASSRLTNQQPPVSQKSNAAAVRYSASTTGGALEEERSYAAIPSGTVAAATEGRPPNLEYQTGGASARPVAVIPNHSDLLPDHTGPVWLPMAVPENNGPSAGKGSMVTQTRAPHQEPALSRSTPESQWLRHWGRRSLISAPNRQSELERKRQYRIALNFFNKKPERGVQFLVDFGFVEGTPGAVAKLLISRKGLSRQMIGEYLGNLMNPFNMAVLECFANEVDMTGVELDVALRQFQSLFRLPGEAQKIERIVEVFSRRYCDCNPEVVKQFRHADTIFLLAFAIIMLNTDSHSPNIKPERRMKVEDFMKNLRGIDGGGDVDAKVLTGIYHRVREQEFRPGSDHVSQVLKVDRSIVGKKPTLALPHRRLVCYCRLYEVTDAQKKQAPTVHQREIFLFNDVILITKILSRKKNAVTYAFRSCHSLVGMQVQPFRNQHYANGLRINHTLENKTFLFNARTEEDRTKFMEDLKESICESDEMEALRIELELEKQNKFCGGNAATSPTNRSHSLGRGEQRDSGLPDLDDPNAPAAAVAPKGSQSSSGGGAKGAAAGSTDESRESRPRCASLTSLDSGMSSTASVVSRESSPKNTRPSTTDPPSTSRSDNTTSEGTGESQRLRPFVDVRNRRHSGSLTPPPEVTFCTGTSEV